MTPEQKNDLTTNLLYLKGKYSNLTNIGSILVMVICVIMSASIIYLKMDLRLNFIPGLMVLVYPTLNIIIHIMYERKFKTLSRINDNVSYEEALELLGLTLEK